MFTNERLFTVQAFTITRVHCTDLMLHDFELHKFFSFPPKHACDLLTMGTWGLKLADVLNGWSLMSLIVECLALNLKVLRIFLCDFIPEVSCLC